MNTIIIIASELTRQTAGTPRLDRFTSNIIQEESIVLIDTASFWKSKEIIFKNKDEYHKFRENIENSKAHYRNGSRAGIIVNIFRKIKHFFLMELFTPSLINGILIINKYKNDKVKILASSPSVNNLFLGYILKKLNYKAYLWVDLRDEWALHSHIYFHKKLRSFIEKAILGQSNIITTVSNGIKRKLTQKYLFDKVEVIYNFDAKGELVAAIENNIFDKNKINMGYFGSMPDGYYDEKLFLEYVDLSIQENVIFYFWGFSGNIKLQLSEDKYKNSIKFLPAVSHEEALRLMKTLDVLIFFAYDKEDNGGIVSTKLLEYINSSTKILPFSIRKNSDIDILMSNCCSKSVYICDLNYFIKNVDYIQELPFKTSNDCFTKMRDTQENIIARFLYEK